MAAEGHIGGTPFPWVDALVRIVTQVGFPVVAAAVLLYFVLFRFTEQVSAVATRLEVVAAAIDRDAINHSNEIHELKRQTKTLERQTAAFEEVLDRMRRKQEPDK